MYKLSTRYRDDRFAAQKQEHTTNFQNGFSLIFIAFHAREGRCFVTRVLPGL